MSLLSRLMRRNGTRDLILFVGTRFEEIASAHFRVRALILRRIIRLVTKLHRCVPGPAWIEQHAASKSDQVGLSAGNNCLRVARLGNQSDRHGGDAGVTPDALRER